MEFKWINKNNNKNLILFFNGWAMNEEVVQNLDCDGFDVLCLYDYRNLNTDKQELIFDNYNKKYLVCWSMGVYVANLFIEKFADFNKKIAIAGTNKIIDNQFGIPEKIYNYTIKFFNDESALKFIKSIFDNDYSFKIVRNTIELKEELISIKNLKIDCEIKFDKVIIPDNDKIIPSKNQLSYWQSKNLEIVKLNSSHYIFDKFKSWQDIIC